MKYLIGVLLLFALPCFAAPPAPTLHVATVTLAKADILALHVTQFQLVAAPGPGKYLLPVKLTASSFGTLGYVSTATGLFVNLGADTGMIRALLILL